MAILWSNTVFSCEWSSSWATMSVHTISVVMSCQCESTSMPCTFPSKVYSVFLQFFLVNLVVSTCIVVSSKFLTFHNLIYNVCTHHISCNVPPVWKYFHALYFPFKKFTVYFYSFFLVNLVVSTCIVVSSKFLAFQNLIWAASENSSKVLV